MEFKINNYNELLEFIKRDDINPKQATEIVCKALNVICPITSKKDEVIKNTVYYIKTFCQNSTDVRPIFLNQKNAEFNISDFYS